MSCVRGCQVAPASVVTWFDAKRQTALTLVYIVGWNRRSIIERHAFIDPAELDVCIMIRPGESFDSCLILRSRYSTARPSVYGHRTAMRRSPSSSCRTVLIPNRDTDGAPWLSSISIFGGPTFQYSSPKS